MEHQSKVNDLFVVGLMDQLAAISKVEAEYLVGVQTVSLAFGKKLDVLSDIGKGRNYTDSTSEVFLRWLNVFCVRGRLFFLDRVSALRSDRVLEFRQELIHRVFLRGF